MLSNNEKLNRLTEECFQNADASIRTFEHAVRQSLGRSPTPQEVADLLHWAVQHKAKELFALNPRAATITVEYKAMGKRGQARLKAGDVVAIPAARGGFFRAVFIASNRFGTAFGICRGRFALRSPGPHWLPDPMPIPYYCHPQFVKTGRWPIVAHLPELLRLFPRSLVRYHAKADHPANERVGEFGSAETTEGVMRHLTKVEAESLGLFRTGFSQSFIGESCELYLNTYNQDPLDASELRSNNSTNKKPADTNTVTTIDQFVQANWFEDWENSRPLAPVAQSRRLVVNAATKLQALSDERRDDKITVIRKCVQGFNKLDEKKQFIDTIEREDICACLEKLMALFGLLDSIDVIEEEREW